MLSAIFVAVALLYSAHAYDDCQADFDAQTSLNFEQKLLDEIEGSAKPCCLPSQLTGSIWLKTLIKPRFWAEGKEVDGVDSGLGWPFKPMSIVGEGTYAVDYSKGLFRVNQDGIVSHKWRFNFSTIQIEEKKALYIVDWLKKICVIRSAERPIDHHCLSPNATLLAQPTFGLGNAGLKINIFGEKFSTPGSCGGSIAMVTANKCAPFVVEVESFSRKTIKYSSMSYFDQKTSIRDTSVFNPPSFCRTASEAGYDFVDEELPPLIKEFVKMVSHN